MDTTTSTTTEIAAPLAWDAQGERISIPGEAVKWRVRRSPLTNGRGAPELISSAATGGPLFVSLEATADDFLATLQDAVGGLQAGRYRLDAVDARGRVCSDRPACVVVSPPAQETEASAPLTSAAAPPPAAPVADPLGRAFDTIERMAKSSADALANLTAQQGAMISKQAELIGAMAQLVAAVDAAGVSSRQPPPVIVTAPPADPAATAAAATPAKPAAPPPTGIEQFSKLVESLGPMLKALPGILEFVKSMSPAAASPSPGPGTPPPPETPPSPTPYSNGTHTSAGGAS